MSAGMSQERRLTCLYPAKTWSGGGPGSGTNRLDHLGARGLVRRRPDPSDARSVRVQLTTGGRRRVDAALEDLVTRENAILGALDAAERVSLAELLRRVVAPFDA